MLGVTQNRDDGRARPGARAGRARARPRGARSSRTPIAVYFGARTAPGTARRIRTSAARARARDVHAAAAAAWSAAATARRTRSTRTTSTSPSSSARGSCRRATAVTDVRALAASGGYERHADAATGACSRRDARTMPRAARSCSRPACSARCSCSSRASERGSLPRLSRALGDYVRTNSEAIIGVRRARPTWTYSTGIAISASIHADGRHARRGRALQRGLATALAPARHAAAPTAAAACRAGCAALARGRATR